MGLSHGSGIFDIRKQSIIKRKGFIEEELEYDKISRGRYGCSRPFSKISAMLEQTTKISGDVLDIISINMQEKTKGYNTTENIKLTATLIGQCC